LPEQQGSVVSIFAPLLIVARSLCFAGDDADGQEESRLEKRCCRLLPVEVELL